MKKILVTALLCLNLSGCLGNFTVSGLASTMATAGAGAVGVAVGGPAAGIGAGIAAGALTDGAIREKHELSDLTSEEKAAVIKNQNLWQTVQQLGGWAIVALLVFMLTPVLIGYLGPIRRQRLNGNGDTSK